MRLKYKVCVMISSLVTLTGYAMMAIGLVASGVIVTQLPVQGYPELSTSSVRTHPQKALVPPYVTPVLSMLKDVVLPSETVIISWPAGIKVLMDVVRHGAVKSI